MNLTKANFKDLKKVAVKIDCSNGSEGSGIIVAVNDELYVLTAAHVIEKGEDNITYLSKEQIVVSITRNNVKCVFAVEEVLYYNRVNDAAVMRVSNTNNMPTSGLDKVRLLTTSVSGPAELCGFHKGEQMPKLYAFEKRGDNIWATVNIQIKVQSLEPVINFEGISGGGIFYQDTAKVLYVSAYMSEVGRHDGNNNEFVCLPSSNFIASGVLGSIVDERDYEYIADSGVANSVASRQLLNPLDRSGYDTNQTGPLMSNGKTEEIINQLRDDDETTILLTALSGMGKTKLIYEAFKDTERTPHRYYAKFGSNREQLLGEMTTILIQNDDSDGIIIVDDCPMELITEVISTRNKYNDQFRLIMANHDYFNEELAYLTGCTIIKLNPQDMEERVNLYISEELDENETNRSDINEIKKLAGGYPQMALKLVEAYQKNESAGPEAVAQLMPQLLNLSEEYKKEEKTVMQTLSLCMPMPYQNATHEGFEYLLKENHITPLNGMEYEERRSLAGKLVDRYYPTLIDVQGVWLYVRPFPLAVWLTSEWFKNVCNRPIHFKELIDSIRQQPESVQNTISEGFCKHIQQMSGNKEAFKMVADLVNADINHPFFDEENLCSGLGSKLFLAMCTVNPAAIAASLRRVLGSKDIAWLREKFDGDGRRNVVWALERLCFAAESYNDGVMMMARLAAAENEDIGNNATGQLVQLFHIALAGTEVNLQTRLETLRELIHESDEYIPLLVRCFDAALRNRGFTKMGGAEKFGFENRKDYTPETWNEIFEYWHGCRDILLEWMEEKPEVAELLAGVVEENVYHWARGGQKDVFVPLMEKIAEIKDYRWDSGYEALAKTVYSFGIDAKILGVNELMVKLKNSSFKTKINEARYILHGKYHLGNKEQFELSERLFAPLADEFIERNVFLSAAEVAALMDDKEYIPVDFVKPLATKATDEQLRNLFETIASVIKTKPEEYYSPFLGNLSSYTKDRMPLNTFLDNLRDRGRKLLYVSLMAGTDDDELTRFHQLIAEQKVGALDLDILPIYLRFFRSYGEDRYLLMLKALRDNFPDRPNELVAYVETERFMMRKNEHPEAVAIVKEALLKFVIDGDSGRMLYEYSRILVETLQQWHDVEFAKQVNRKMISVYNSQMVHLSTEGIFTELLKDYFDDVWPEFVKAFLGPDTFLFYYQVKDELGSGFGFGKGPLFDLDERLIKNLCFDYPDSAPVRIASMVPCFDTPEEEKETEQFSKWVLWLLDNFGKQKDVRSSISGNLGSFSWTGNVSPYYERNIKCFEKLLNHQIAEVREWAQNCISDERKLLEMEKNKEDFMRIRYGV